MYVLHNNTHTLHMHTHIRTHTHVHTLAHTDAYTHLHIHTRTLTTQSHTRTTTHHTPLRCIVDILATSMLIKWTEWQPRYSRHSSCSPFHAHTLSDCFTLYSFLAVHFVSVPPFRNFSLPIPMFLFCHSNAIIPFQYFINPAQYLHSPILCPFTTIRLHIPFLLSFSVRFPIHPFHCFLHCTGSGLPEACQLPARSHRGM